MARITTVIFDVYETLAVNNTGLWVETCGGICRDQGLSVDPGVFYSRWKALELGFRKERLNMEEPEKSPPFKSYYQAWKECFVDVFAQLGLPGDAGAAAQRTVEDMGKREAYGDAVEALPQIQEGWRTGILSNADDAYLFPLLEKIGWDFEVVLSSEGARAYKPLPSAFEQVMGALGVGPEECLYVGDTPFDDILGARGVGMGVAWINRHGASLDGAMPAPDYEVRSLGELPAILQRSSE